MTTKICHITTVHKYSDIRIFQKECTSLSKNYEVHLIAPNVDDCVINEIIIHGVCLPTNRLKRFLCLSKVRGMAISVDAEIYHLHDPELIKLGIKLKRLGKKVIFDSHEDIPIDIREKKWIPYFLRLPMSYYYQFLQEVAFKKFDAIISVTPSIVDKLKRINPETYQITNYPKKTTFEDNRKWGNSVCFAGTVSPKWFHSNIAKSLKKLNVTYKIAGPVSEDYIEELKKGENGSKIEYIGTLENKMVKSFLQESFAGMALYDYLPSFGNTMGSLGNNKIFEYMAAGIPVIATDFVLWKEIIEKNNCGICVNPHNVDEISQAINYLLDNPDKAKEMGENGITLTQKYYNWNSQEEILYTIYKKVEAR